MEDRMTDRLDGFPPQVERIELGGVELHYLDVGRGDPVLLVHGGGDDLRYWEAQVPALVERYRVIAYSRRHSAPNDNPIASSSHSARVEAADLGRLIDALGLDGLHLVGHSYGALTSLTYATDRSDRLRTLTLCEPPVLSWAAEVPGADRVVREFMDSIWRPAGERFRDGDPGAMRFLLDGIIGEGFFDGLPEELRARTMGNARDMEALCMSTDPFPPLSIEAVRKLAVPTLLLTGARTTPINTIGLKVLERSLPDRVLSVVPDASHEVFVENPTVSTAELLAFLAR
jgi:pimeloyl-ACP methyl ester carboxylesterase